MTTTYLKPTFFSQPALEYATAKVNFCFMQLMVKRDGFYTEKVAESPLAWLHDCLYHYTPESLKRGPVPQETHRHVQKNSGCPR
jgi:hypothetical protein